MGCERCKHAFDPDSEPERQSKTNPHLCVACADVEEEEKRYREHLDRGGKPYSAWLGKQRIV